MSSVSYAEANHEKFIHAHQIPKNTRMYFPTGAPTEPPSAKAWWRLFAACATATTKTRSKNSSSGVDDR